MFFKIFITLGALGVSLGFGVPALINYINEFGEHPPVNFVAQKSPVPLPLLASPTLWHDHFCHDARDRCETMNYGAELEDGHWPPTCSPQYVAAAVARAINIQQTLGRSWVLLAKPRRVDLACCMNPSGEAPYQMIALAEDTERILLTPIPKDLTITRVKMAIWNKKHCLAPPMEPLAIATRHVSRHYSRAPDHYHCVLFDDGKFESNRALADSVAVWSRYELPFRSANKFVTLLGKRLFDVPVHYWVYSPHAVKLAQTALSETTSEEPATVAPQDGRLGGEADLLSRARLRAVETRYNETLQNIAALTAYLSPDAVSGTAKQAAERATMALFEIWADTKGQVILQEVVKALTPVLEKARDDFKVDTDRFKEQIASIVASTMASFGYVDVAPAARFATELEDNHVDGPLTFHVEGNAIASITAIVKGKGPLPFSDWADEEALKKFDEDEFLECLRLEVYLRVTGRYARMSTMDTSLGYTHKMYLRDAILYVTENELQLI